MEPMQMILLAVAAFVALWIIFKIAKAVFKVALFLAVMLFGYIFFFGGSIEDVSEPILEQMFKKNTIEELMAKHCNPEKKDVLRCDCILMPVYGDLNKRFNETQMKELSQDHKRMTDEALISFKNEKENIKACANEKKSGWLKAFDFIRSLF